MQKGLKVIVLVGLFLSLASQIPAQDNYKVVNGPEEFYYGHISFVDTKNEGKDPIILREGNPVPEPAVLNLPLGPGDTVQTFDARRCEIQFDNGTIIRLDYNTRLKIETILAKSLSSNKKISNLVLRAGGIYVMYKQYNSKEMFQIFTPNASVKFAHNTVAIMALGEDSSWEIQVKYGKAYVLYGPDLQNQKEQIVGKYEKLAISPDNTFAFRPYVENTDYETWNKAINEDFQALHEGKSTLPKPIQKLPWAVYYFAQKYGSHYGEWLYDEMYGYIWRPFTNHQMYPWGWQPYIFGHWSSYGGQMYWVPDEPWGWVPYHLGVWQWDEKKGWFWIPGSAFAPAWVDWAFFGYGGMYAWRPWSFWDWMSFYDWDYMWGMFGYSPYDYGFGWYPYYYQGGPSWGIGVGMPSRKILYTVSRDQLKKPSAPRYSIPKDMKGVYKALLAALKKGDTNALSSLQALGRSAVVVKSSDLKDPQLQGKVVQLDSLMKTLEALPSQAPQKMILNIAPKSVWESSTYTAAAQRQDGKFIEIRNAGPSPNVQIAGAGAAPSKSPQRPFPGVIRSLVPGPTALIRTHDWNPDMKVAQKLGVDIRYSSMTNEVYCPQLRISSNWRMYEPSRGSSSSGSFGSGSASGSSSGSSGSSGSSAGTSSGTSSGSSGSTAKGGVIKNEDSFSADKPSLTSSYEPLRSSDGGYMSGSSGSLGSVGPGASSGSSVNTSSATSGGPGGGAAVKKENGTIKN